MQTLTVVAPTVAETTGAAASAPGGIANTDPRMVLRLWSVIDVYGRVRRASGAEDRRVSARGCCAGDAVA